MRGRIFENGENFSGEKFSPDPFQKTLKQGEEYG